MLLEKNMGVLEKQQYIIKKGKEKSKSPRGTVFLF